jgi:hypothetical protein
MARSRPHRGANTASDTRFWASFGVAIALFLQVLFPTHVMAMSRSGETVFVMCSGDGLNAQPVVDYNLTATLKAEDSTKTQGLKCPDCVLASLTAIVPDTTRYEVVQYPAIAAIVPLNREHERPQSQAPPRPHSCGPPHHI